MWPRRDARSVNNPPAPPRGEGVLDLACVSHPKSFLAGVRVARRGKRLPDFFFIIFFASKFPLKNPLQGPPQGPQNRSKFALGVTRECPGEAPTPFLIDFGARRPQKLLLEVILRCFSSFFLMFFLTIYSANWKMKKCISTCKLRYNMRVGPCTKMAKRIEKTTKKNI